MRKYSLTILFYRFDREHKIKRKTIYVGEYASAEVDPHPCGIAFRVGQALSRGLGRVRAAFG